MALEGANKQCFPVLQIVAVCSAEIRRQVGLAIPITLVALAILLVVLVAVRQTQVSVRLAAICLGQKPNATGFGGAQGNNAFGGTNNATGGFWGATTLGGGMVGMQGGSQQQLMHTGQFPYQARGRSSKGRDADVNIKHAAISIEVPEELRWGDYYTMNIRNVKQAVGNIAGAVGAKMQWGQRMHLVEAMLLGLQLVEVCLVQKLQLDLGGKRW